MADGVLSNVVGNIITKVRSLALDEIGLWWGVKGELKKLEATVSSIRNVLLNAVEKQKLNRLVKGSLERLEEVVYDADDLVDDFATEALRRRVMTGNRMTKEVNLFFSSSNQLVYGFKMGHKIKAIRERLADIVAEWPLFLRNEQSKISQDDDNLDDSIMPTLKLSYDHLPSHLKHCFAYCALYPKDYEIDVKTLIHLWVAQGFVEALNTSDCFEDIGLEYFMKLWWRSFFQEVKRDRFGNVQNCKMHDLTHDLATTVGGKRIQLVNSDPPNIDEKIRHVALNLDVAPQEILNNAKKLRSFF